MARKHRKGYYVDGRWVPADGGADQPPPDDAEPPSRTARKHASRELQDIGERLLDLPPEELAALAIPEALKDAVLEALRLTSFGARRRQLQYIGKLMRRLDPEAVQAVRAAVTAGPRRGG